MNGEYGERYYTPDTHEGIVSKETWQRAQEIRQQRENPKLIGQESPVYTFTSKIRCGQCGAHYQHKVHNSGKKWQNDIWCCATSLRKGVAACNCTRIKDSVLREKFVEAYNEFVTKRPVGTQIKELQEEIERLMNEDTCHVEIRKQFRFYPTIYGFHSSIICWSACTGHRMHDVIHRQYLIEFL